MTILIDKRPWIIICSKVVSLMPPSVSENASSCSLLLTSPWFMILKMYALNSSASFFFNTIVKSVESAVDMLFVSIFTLHVPISISNRFCSVLILEMFFIPMVFFSYFKVFFSKTMEVPSTDMYVLDQRIYCIKSTTKMTAKNPPRMINSQINPSSVLLMSCIISGSSINCQKRIPISTQKPAPVRSIITDI